MKGAERKLIFALDDIRIILIIGRISLCYTIKEIAVKAKVRDKLIFFF